MMILIPRRLEATRRVFVVVWTMLLTMMTAIYCSEGGEVVTVDLHVQAIRFEEGPIFFSTRAYNGHIPGPTIRVKQGDTLVINLFNELTGNRTDGPNNWFKLPNTTNLHLHGLHVSPAVDDVFAEVGPGENRQFNYTIADDHPTGIFWYHPHVHGSSSLQQSGGMAGAIVVEPQSNESLPVELLVMEEEVVVLQHLCFRDLGKYQSSAPYMNHLELSKYGLDLLDPNPSYKYPDLPQDFYLANGKYLSNVTLAPGEFRLLRLVAAGTQAFLEIAVEDDDESATNDKNSSSPCEMYVIAKDGYFVPKVYAVDFPLLVPGSRMDLAIRCALPGSYRVVSRPGVAPYHSQLAQTTVVFDGVLFNLQVAGPSKNMSLPRTLPNLPSYMPDLRDANVSSTPFTWSFHSIGGPFKPGFPFPTHEINGASFTDPDTFATNISLGVAQEWFVQIEGDSDVGAGNHPFHAHVNAFQIVGIGNGGMPTDLFGVRVGEYRDTVPLSQSAPYTVRFVPDRFTGRALVHCHMIPHVDLGMAAVMGIVDSGERPGDCD